jgi:hypothetical protein
LVIGNANETIIINNSDPYSIGVFHIHH